MKIAFYFPGKPLAFKTPSGDRTIAESIIASAKARGHIWLEMTDFRSRWFWRSFSSIAQLPIEAWKTAKRFRSFSPHVWVTYHSYYKSPDLFGWWLAAPSIPYVIIQPMRANKRRKKARTKIGAVINDIAIRKAHLLISNNLNDLEALKAFVPGEKLCYIPPGIFPEVFSRDSAAANQLRLKLSIPDGVPVLLTVCRFREGVKWQSLAFLFDALAILSSEKTFILLVVGSGPLRSLVEHYAIERLENRVRFIGEVPHSRLFPYYSLADLFVFPGIKESLGMVYLEAQSCGCPVVALDGEGVRQVISHGETGLLVSPPVPEAYAKAISWMLDNPDVRQKMGERAVIFVRKERNANINNLRVMEAIENLVAGR
ncbi:MAG: glycosyltransferase family 4 protein [Thermodesulforhabdaceae bacterium]